MQHQLYLEVISCVAEAGFSLDELVGETKLLFETEGMPGFVGLLLQLVDEQLCRRLVAGQPVAAVPGCACGQPRWEVCAHTPRRFRTSVGEVRITWRRLRCRTCGRSLIPLQRVLGLDRCQSKTVELEQLVVELVSEQSFRRSSRALQGIGLIPVPKTTAHRWLQQSPCGGMPPPEELSLLMSDGTGYKRRPTAEATNRGEVRVVIGVTRTGEVQPLGAWSGETWPQIGEAIAPPPAPEEPPRPLADLLLADGESGMAEGLAHLVRDVGRCHWHYVRDLDAVLWKQNVPLEERREWQQRLAAVLEVTLPDEEWEQVPAEGKAAVAAQLTDVERGLHALALAFRLHNCPTAARYLDQATTELTAYLRLWLRCGVIAPRATGLIERLMRELGRRLKKIGFGWTEPGAAQMARIVLKRCTAQEAWDTFWAERLRRIGNVHLVFRGIRAVES